MSTQPPIDLDRLEALANDPRILPYLRPGWTILNTETLNLYNAARTALPTLIAAYRQLTIVAVRADALAQADAALIQSLEGRLSKESAENEQLRAQVARANELIAMQDALIRTFERGHALDRAMIDQLSNELIGSQADAYKAAHPGLEDIAYARAYEQFRDASDDLTKQEPQ